MSDKRTLKPCPFCGGDAGYLEDLRFEEQSENFPKWYVKCKSCGVKTPTSTISQVQGIWNRRTI